MCQFPSFALAAYGFSGRVPGHDPRWVFPLGDLGVLAWLAARPSFSQLPHVRHRFLAPKHPPHTLCSLTMFYGPPFPVWITLRNVVKTSPRTVQPGALKWSLA